MNRVQTIVTYYVQSGEIRSVGMFFGEPIYAPYFHRAWVNGGGHVNGIWQVFNLTEEDLAEFPELANKSRVLIRKDCNGFIHCKAT